MTDATPVGKRLLKAIGWSIAFALIGVALVVVLSAVAGSVLYGGGMAGQERLRQVDRETALVNGSIQLVAFLVATWAVGLRGCKLSWHALRWDTGSRGLRGFGSGLALGAAAAAAAVGVGAVVGVIAWSRDGGGLGEYLAGAALTTLALAPAALSEEVMFRGLPLVLLARVIGRWPALVLVAGAVFGLIHASNPNSAPLALVNIALAGLWLGAAFYAPGGIWTAFGAHLGWNAALAAVDAPVSGLTFRLPLLDYHAGAPCWISGCRFGPEGGLLATAALGAALLVALHWARKETA
ncbi:MAG TPA: CPBP family intramembrane glutamic endopeptidase [Gemmatimonadales bacterium]|nr:CPBP family intramembrane glutamic endopeptidase [Gemmatimonadales bacterium]